MQATTTPFTHTPRPALVPPESSYAWQRRYGAGATVRDCSLQPAAPEARAMEAALEVFRDGGSDLAEVRVALGIYTGAQITVRLSADELRDLAMRLIDAAHDIDTLPAAVLARTTEGAAA